MKILTLLCYFNLFSMDNNGQSIVIHSISKDSLQLQIIKDGCAFSALMSEKGKIDTVWQEKRPSYVTKIRDVKIFEEGIVIIYDSEICTHYLGRMKTKDGWGLPFNFGLSCDTPLDATTYEIINYDSVKRTKRHGTKSQIIFDFEKRKVISRKK
jgi:hypothetical protein